MLQCNVSCLKNNLFKKSKNHIKQHCPPKNGKNHTVFLIKNVAEYYLKCQYRYATNQYNLSPCPHTPHPISITRAGVLSLFYYEIFKIRQFFLNIFLALWVPYCFNPKEEYFEFNNESSNWLSLLILPSLGDYDNQNRAFLIAQVWGVSRPHISRISMVRLVL